MTTERKWALGSEIEVKGKTFRVVMLHTWSPDIEIAYLNHPFRPWFTIPSTLFDVLYESCAKEVHSDEG